MRTQAALLAADLDLSTLPSCPRVVSRLLQALEQERPAPSTLTFLLACDPVLCLRALSGAAATGELVHAAPSVESALSIAGPQLVRTIAVDAAAPRQSPADNQLDLDLFWGYSLLAGELCRSLARESAYEAPEEAYAAGLMHNLGQLAFLSGRPSRYAELLACSGEGALVSAEQEAFGFSHAELGAQLIDRWEHRSFVGDAIRFHHEPPEACAGSHALVRIVRSAVALLNSSPEEASRATSALLHLPTVAVDRALREARTRASQVSADLGIPFSADHEALAPMRGAILCPVADGKGPTTGSASAEQQILASLHDVALKHALTQLFAAGGAASDVIGTLAQATAGLLGLEAAMCFLPDASGRVLHGHGTTPRLKAAEGLAVALDTAGSAVQTAFLEGRVVSTEDVAMLSVLDRQILRLAASEAMLCIPLRSGGGSNGVLVAVGAGGARLTSGGLLVALTRLAGDALERVRHSGEAGQRELNERYRAHARRIIHEAGNPLGIIKNYLKVLALRLGDEISVQQELSILNEEIDRVTQIIRRFGEPPTAAPRTAVQVNDILRELITAYGETLFGLRRVAVELALDADVPAIRTDDDALKQALLNLLKNAAEAMPSGGKLVVATSDNINQDGRSYVEVRLKDSGPGIAPETLHHLYQPTKSSKGEGHEGIGLSIVYSIVQRLGGTIVCRSQVGQGTVFQVLLPRDVD